MQTSWQTTPHGDTCTPAQCVWACVMPPHLDRHLRVVGVVQHAALEGQGGWLAAAVACMGQGRGGGALGLSCLPRIIGCGRPSTASTIRPPPHTHTHTFREEADARHRAVCHALSDPGVELLHRGARGGGRGAAERSAPAAFSRGVVWCGVVGTHSSWLAPPSNQPSCSSALSSHLLICDAAALEADAAAHHDDRNHKRRKHVQHGQPAGSSGRRSRRREDVCPRVHRLAVTRMHTPTPAHELPAPLCQVGVDEKVGPRPMVALHACEAAVSVWGRRLWLCHHCWCTPPTHTHTHTTLTRYMQGPSLYSSVVPSLRTLMPSRRTRKLHLQQRSGRQHGGEGAHVHATQAPPPVTVLSPRAPLPHVVAGPPELERLYAAAQHRQGQGKVHRPHDSHKGRQSQQGVQHTGAVVLGGGEDGAVCAQKRERANEARACVQPESAPGGVQIHQLEGLMPLLVVLVAGAGPRGATSPRQQQHNQSLERN
jgi:hypothetical protein